MAGGIASGGAKTVFQFLIVRLKYVRKLDGAEGSMFQFLIVRLKLVRHKQGCRNHFRFNSL